MNRHTYTSAISIVSISFILVGCSFFSQETKSKTDPSEGSEVSQKHTVVGMKSLLTKYGYSIEYPSDWNTHDVKGEYMIGHEFVPENSSCEDEDNLHCIRNFVMTNTASYEKNKKLITDMAFMTHIIADMADFPKEGVTNVQKTIIGGQPAVTANIDYSEISLKGKASVVIVPTIPGNNQPYSWMILTYYLSKDSLYSESIATTVVHSIKQIK